MPVAAATAAHARGHNCCQAVLHAFQEHCQIGDDRIVAARLAGAGRAPGGRCGALHAALDILRPEHHAAVEAAFVSRTGSAACREIRKLRRASCRECVGEAARLVAQRVGSGSA
ncbi:MAG TPA: hypothetical protein DCS97_15225 [Planctomycetes bacterium]|nr:hypothetical protein [Planctomycetota bacterium]